MTTAGGAHVGDSSPSSSSSSSPSQSDDSDDDMNICAGRNVTIGDTVGGSITKTTIHGDHVIVKGHGKVLVTSKYCKYTEVLWHAFIWLVC